MCAFEWEGRPVVASASHDRTVQVWDPGNPNTVIPVHALPFALATAHGQLIVGLENGVILLAIQS